MLNEVAGNYRSSILRKLENIVYGVAVQDTTHLDFTDLIFYSPVFKFTHVLGPIEGERMVKIVNAYTVAF